MPATFLSATWGLSQGRAHRQTRAVLLGTCALPPCTWSGHAHAAENWRVHTQLASGPGEGVGKGQLAFAQILACRVSWGCETSKEEPPKTSQSQGDSQKVPRGFFSTKEKQCR